MDQESLPLPLPRSCRAYLEKLKKKLEVRNLGYILEDHPISSTVTCCEASLFGDPAFKLFLGYRKLVNEATLAEVWAYLVPDHDGCDPPIFIRLKLVVDLQTRIWSQAASSLLRQAENLKQPFRYLQRNTFSNAKRMRSMLCALVLYYFLAAGIDDWAIRWKPFTSELMRALKYIKSDESYNQRMTSSSNSSKMAGNTSMLGDSHIVNVRSGATVGEVSLRGSENVEFSRDILKGGVVYSTGRSLVARRGSALAKLKHAMGSNVSLLDAIPSTNVIFTRQSQSLHRYAFRLHVGTYRIASRLDAIDAWVYLLRKAPSLANTTIICHNSNGQTVASFKFEDLAGLTLREPFSLFQEERAGCSTKIQGIRLHALIMYYFLLAENAGIIDNTGIEFNAGLLNNFLAACWDFEKVGNESRETTGEAITNQGENRRKKEAVTPRRQISSDQKNSRLSEVSTVFFETEQNMLCEPEDEYHEETGRIVEDTPAPAGATGMRNSDLTYLPGSKESDDDKGTYSSPHKGQNSQNLDTKTPIVIDMGSSSDAEENDGRVDTRDASDDDIIMGNADDFIAANQQRELAGDGAFEHRQRGLKRRASRMEEGSVELLEITEEQFKRRV